MGTEACDDGAANSDAWVAALHCNARCTGIGPYCGDGVRQNSYEACDDGTANSDTWSAVPRCGMACVYAPYCGDSVVQAAHETCDDGNSVNGDGCTACSLEAGWKCHSRVSSCVAVTESCSGRPDFTFCDVATSPDRSYDICVGGVCVSPGCGDVSCNTPGPSFTLADTNQRLCYDATAEMAACPAMASCATTAFCGQDAQYGWDTENAASERYVKTEPVAGQPVVRDRITGLSWQGCQAGRSGTACASGSAGSYTWEQALAHCDSSTWGGFADWYLPDFYELQSLVDYGRGGPAIDISVFLQATSVSFWSSSSFIDSGNAWYVAFGNGGIYTAAKTSSSSVYCVRRGPYAGAERFVRSEPVSGQPVVRDLTTDLVWQGCAVGMTGGTCTGTATVHTWQQALQYCQALDWGGYQDWYLPDVKELASIVDTRKRNPAIDTVAFPQTPGTTFRPSSTHISAPNYAWWIGFYHGNVEYASKTVSYSVRCVRRGS